MDIYKQNKTVLTLDAGGTNLVFSAMCAGEFIGQEIVISALANTLDEFLSKLIQGFEQVLSQVEEAHAISFAFPGPADYKNGIIGDLENLKVFKGGVALGPFLSNYFKLPVFINNDGDLFALGESMGGFLPKTNALLRENGVNKSYHNLLGLTFGTGFGAGFVSNNQLLQGDNCAAAEINRMSNPLYPEFSVEESVSIRAIKRVYAREAQLKIENCPQPLEIYKIAIGEASGNKVAALKSFEELAIAAAHAIANSISLLDGLLVIGGGLSGAHSVILPILTAELNKKWGSFSGKEVQRMEVFAYNLQQDSQRKAFLASTAYSIPIPHSHKRISYDPIKKVAIGISELGTTKAVALGAYVHAVQQLVSKNF